MTQAEQPWDRWFNVITPVESIDKLRTDLIRLREMHNKGWEKS